MASLDAIELLAALQLTEQQKLLLIEKLKAFLIALFQVIDTEGKRRNNDIHRKMVLAMASEGADFPWEDRYAKFRELLDFSALNLKIFAHPDRKALLSPLMKRAELVMADYEVGGFGRAVHWHGRTASSSFSSWHAPDPSGRRNRSCNA